MQRTLLIESSRRVGVRLEVRDGEGMRRGHDGDEEQDVQSQPHLSLRVWCKLDSATFFCCFVSYPGLPPAMARLLLALALPVAALGIYPDDHWKYSTKLTVGNFDSTVRLLCWHLRQMKNTVCLADQECRGR